ncbi:MAG: O-antigen ligase family protein [Tissierellales bacterium]|nr:O-antigen ligase family protein [Tissierellales bacterium]
MKAVRDVLLLFIIPLMMITKVIQKPVVVNFSPADFVLVMVGLFLMVSFFMDATYSKTLIRERALYIFIGLIVIRGLSSIVSYHLDVQTLDYPGAVIANLKFILSFFYFIIGVSSVYFLGEKKVFLAIYTTSLLFVIIGLLGQIFFKLSWVTAGSRLIALANDPNVAGLVMILGIIAGFKLIDESTSLILKTFIWTSFIFLGFGLILTGSRTALLAVGLVIGMLLITYTINPRKLILTCSIGFLLVASALYIDDTYLDAQSYEYLVNRVVYGTESSTEFRTDLIQIANAMGKDHVLTGIGTGNYILNASEYADQMDIKLLRDQIVHNTFFSFYGENGIFATLLYGLLFVYFIYKVRHPYALMYLAVLLTYSLFFNVENIRILWFSYGVYLFSTVEKGGFKTRLSLKKSISIALSCVLMGCFIMPVLTLPYTASGQVISFLVDGDVAIYMELENPQKKDLKVNIHGPTERELIIKNSLGFYYEPLDLEPGVYQMIIDSPDASVGIKRLDIISHETQTVEDKLLSLGGLETIVSDDSRKLDLVNGFYEYDVDEKYLDRSILYKGEISGVNYNDEIALVSSVYNANPDGTTKVVATFKKIGEVSKDYILLFRVYPVNQETFEKVNQKALKYQFDTPLTELEIGTEFTAEWIFDTDDKVYMMYYGFYHKDKESEIVTRPYPLYFREGFVQ